MKKNKVFILFYIFLLVYFPLINGINVIHVLSIYAFFSILIKKNYRKEIVKIVYQSKIFVVILGVGIIIMYMLVFYLLNGTQNISNIYIYILLLPEVIICIVYLCLYLCEYQFTKYDLLNLLLCVCMLQAIIAILAFVNTEFHHLTLTWLKEEVSTNYYNQWSEVRLFGFSSGLTSTMPVLQAMMTCIAVFLGITKQKKYFFYAPVLAFSAIINSRTSFIILGIGGILLIFFNKSFDSKKFLVLILAVLITIFCSVFIAKIIKLYSGGTFDWLHTGLLEISDFFKGEKIGTFNVLLGNGFLRIPEGNGFWLGTGHDIYGFAQGSDNGFINDIWRIGVLWTFFLYIVFFMYFSSILKKGNKFNNFISCYFILIILIFSFKGTIISSNCFLNTALLIIAYINVEKKRDYKNEIGKHLSCNI